MPEPVIILLLFVTLWIIIIVAAQYLIRRTRVLSPGGRREVRPVSPVRSLPAPVVMHSGQDACCLDVPCSAACARRQQYLRERADAQYDRVIAEMHNIIASGDGAPDADGYGGQPVG